MRWPASEDHRLGIQDDRRAGWSIKPSCAAAGEGWWICCQACTGPQGCGEQIGSSEDHCQACTGPQGCGEQIGSSEDHCQACTGPQGCGELTLSTRAIQTTIGGEGGGP